ncbi:uroporphyrinogen decarboxylase family protein [candidate division KSB1 bacterium]
MINSILSRDRLLSVLNLEKPDYIPCCFMIFYALRKQCKDEFEFIERQLELGIDVRVNLPEFGLNFHPDVSINEWKDHPNGEKFPHIHREYTTPKGALSTAVKLTEDWPYGERVPLFDDFVAPRAVKYLVTEQDDLEKLKYLLLPPDDDNIIIFREEARKLKKTAVEKGLLVCGGWNSWFQKKGEEIDGGDYGAMGVDALMWLCGPSNPIYWAFDRPDFLKELIQMIHQWNIKRIEIYLDEGVDLIIRRAWYESTDFWSPALYRKFIVPVLQKEIDMVHQAGAKFGYISTSGIMPLVDDYVNLGIDVLIGVDPLLGKGADIKTLKKKADGKFCLWGGVNGHITIEMGTESDIENSIEKSMQILAQNSGFILSPVDNVSDDSEETWNNVNTFINTWKELRYI